MASVVTSFATFEAENLDLFMKPVFEDPAITDLGINVVVANNPQYAYFNTNLDKKTIEKTDCGWTYQTGVAVTKKKITPVEFELAIEQCYTDFVGTIYGGSLPAGAAKGELTPEITNWLLNIHNTTFRNDMVRKLFLSNTADTDTFYSSIDGIYTKLAASSSPDAGGLSSGSITQANIEATLWNIYNSQSSLLQSLPDSEKVLWVTNNIFQAWKRWIQANVATFNNDRVVNGLADSQVTFNGIKMVALPFVDRALAADFVTSGLTDYAYRAILTVPSNHHLVVDKGSFGDATAWYSMDDNVFRIAGTATMAYEYGYDELNVIAGF